MHPLYIVLINLVGLCFTIPMMIISIRAKQMKAKAKHEAEMEKKRFQANVELEKEKIILEKELAKPKYCSYCGSENNQVSNFCESCGSKFFENVK